jgi:hypothetical protein
LLQRPAYPSFISTSISGSPGGFAPSEGEWRETQRGLLAGDAWIVDGNYHETLDFRLERPDTIVFLDMPWSVCAGRAFRRGLSKPIGEMPDGCDDSAWRRLRDEWRLAVVILRNRRSEPEREHEIISQRGQHAAFTCSGPNGQLRSSWMGWTSRTTADVPLVQVSRRAGTYRFADQVGEARK